MMKLTKKFLFIAWAALGSLAFNSCSSDEPVIIDPVEVSSGVFVLNQGVMSASLPGTLTYYDYAKGTTAEDIFASANGTVLGDTPQDVLVYGAKVYLAVYQSNLIRILDRNTLKVIKDIRPTGEHGTQPRYLTADGGKVYVSMYDGYAARIDTVSMDIDASVKVGPNPDGVAVYAGNLYVANSDGMNYLNGYADGKTLSQIDLKSFTETRKIEVGLNPGPVTATDNGIFFVTRGNYADIPSQLKALKANGTTEVIAEASLISSKGGDVYYFNASYGADPVTAVGKYNGATGQKSSINIETVKFPADLGVDPVTEDIVISAYNESNGYADYTGPGYAVRFSSTGQKLSSFTVGVNPCAIAFNTSLALPEGN